MKLALYATRHDNGLSISGLRRAAARGLLALSAAAALSCNDLLDAIPDNRTEVSDISQIRELLTTAYPNGSYVGFLEPRTDNSGDRGPGMPYEEQYNEDAFFWRQSEKNDSDTPVNYWVGCYEAIAAANHALEALAGMDQERNDVKETTGEALLCRAYAHFMLVNIWAEHYHPAADALGITYVTEPEDVALKEYERNTVKEVYEKTEEDMLRGIELVGSDYDHPKFHFTKRAAYVFATRFYLFKGEWSKVIEYADRLFEAQDASAAIRDWPRLGSLPPDNLIQAFASAEESSNLLVSSVESAELRARGRRYGMDFEAAQFIVFSSPPSGSRWRYPGYSILSRSYFVPKFQEYFKYTNFTNNVGEAFTAFVLLVTDEALLSRAEAYTMLGDYDRALQDVSTLLSKNVVGYTGSVTADDLRSTYGLRRDKYNAFYLLPADDQGMALLNGILEIRRRVFLHEALRWFDIKRYHIRVAHKDLDKNRYYLEPFDPRRVLQIPEAAQIRGVRRNLVEEDLEAPPTLPPGGDGP